MFLTPVLADDTSKSLSEAEIMKVASVLDRCSTSAPCTRGGTHGAPKGRQKLNQKLAGVLRAVKSTLSPWKNAFYFGSHQQLMHAGLAWMQMRNVLDIEVNGNTRDTIRIL